MFRYHMSLGTSTRVPRDLITGNLRMVFLHHKATAASEPDGKWGESPSSFHSAPSIPFLPPLNIFYFGSQGWMGSSVKTRFIYFQKNKEVMNVF
jgi:hypothetical protein